MNNLREFQPMQMQEEWAKEEGIDLLQYWNVIDRKKWPIMALAAVVSIIAALVAYSMTPIYRATATIQIESQTANLVSIQEIYGIDTRAQQYYATQFAILASRPLAERVVAQLKLADHPAFKAVEKESRFNFDWRSWLPFSIPMLEAATETTASEPDSTRVSAGQYLGSLSIQPLRGTQLVDVHYSSEHPQLAAHIANAHANAYIESQLDARVDMTQSANSWMIRRLKDLKLALAESEVKLQTYREEEKVIDMDGLQSLPAKEINQLSSQLVETRQALFKAKGVYFQLRQMRNASINELSAVPAVMNDELAYTLQEDRAELERRVGELADRYQPGAPQIVDAKSELAVVNSSLAQQIRNVIETSKIRYEEARQQEQELISSLERAKQEYYELGRKESDFRALQQEVEGNRQLYDMFYTRIQETSQTDDLDSANARIISPAIVPTQPIKPRKKRIVILAFVVSIMFGIVAAFLLEMLNNTIKSSQDIEEKLKQAMLGMLPLVKLKGKNASTGHLFFDDKQHGFAEAVRTVRTGISLSNLDDPHKTILVTSSVSGEGKTTTALNLAYAFGQVEKVLLIDADMRRPSIGKEFKISRDHAGLSELVAGTAQLKECVLRRPEEKIDVLIAGMIPPNPQELLSSRKLTAMLKVLREHYDRIIIDCPPILPVSDARVLSTHADSVVYVVKADATSIKQVKTGLDHLHNINAPVTGIVLSQLDTRKAEKYSDYGYGNYYESYESHPA